MTASYVTLESEMQVAKRFARPDWIAVFDNAIKHAMPGLMLEFGVAGGNSIRHVARLISPRRIHGFDWWNGLPESWKNNPAGAFACQMPTDLPVNVELVPGLFQDTLVEWLKMHNGPVAFVNMDADLYSSTDFVLRQIESRFVHGTLIHFDEIRGEPGNLEAEGKAFIECLERTGMIYKVLVKTGTEGALFQLRRQAW